MLIFSKIPKKELETLSSRQLLHFLIHDAVIRQERASGHVGARAEQVRILKELSKRNGWGYSTGVTSYIIDFD